MSRCDCPEPEPSKLSTSTRRQFDRADSSFVCPGCTKGCKNAENPERARHSGRGGLAMFIGCNTLPLKSAGHRPAMADKSLWFNKLSGSRHGALRFGNVMLHGATAHLASTPHDRFRVLETGLRRVLRIPNSRDTDGTRCGFQQGKDNGLDKGSNRVDLAPACIAPRANQ